LLGENIAQPLPAHALDLGYRPAVGASQVNLDEVWNTVVWLLSLVQVFGGGIVVRSRSLIPFIG